MTDEFNIYTVFGTIALIGAIQACGSTPAKSPDECSPEQLGKIEAAYFTAVLEACPGQTLDECEAVPSLDAERQRRKAAWIECGGSK
jgi:hypothetical protein